ECPQADADRLAKTLQGLLSRTNLSPIPSFVRFLFTFRTDPQILDNFTVPYLGIPIDHEEDTEKDILAFVRRQLHGSQFASMFEDVAKISQTLFQCAAVLCRELTGAGPLLATEKEELVQRLKQGPVMSLYDSYRLILKLRFENAGPKFAKLLPR